MHHYCRKQHIKNKNSLFIEQNAVITFCLSISLLCFVLALLYSMVEFFIPWTQYFADILRILNVTSDLCQCSYLINMEKISNRPIKKFYNGGDVNLITAELRHTETGLLLIT